MRLKVHIATANEELIALVNEGYEALSEVQANYEKMKDSGKNDDTKDVAGLAVPVDTWALGRIFPTQLEINLFSDPEIPLGVDSGARCNGSMRTGFARLCQVL